MIIGSLLYLVGIGCLLALSCSGLAKDCNRQINMQIPSYKPEDVRTICCVCGVHKSGSLVAPIISHGYCPECVAKIEADLEEMTKTNKPALDKVPNL